MDEMYSQGISSDGPVILCDGLLMTPDMIVASLNRLVTTVERYGEALEKIDNIIQTSL